MSATPVRLLVIADVGGEDTRHLGDEAMLEANLQGFRRLIPEVAFTVVSRDPAWAAARYSVEAITPVGFPRDPAAGVERAAMLDRLLTDATSRSRGHATIDAVASSDGLVVSGGGNLSSTWPDLLYERAALLHLARIFGKPAVVLGQTIGPTLMDDERRLLADTLSSARFVGLRELPSAALTLDLGVRPERIWYQCDDALVFEGAQGAVQAADRSGPQAIAVTIDPQIRAAGDSVFDALVRQLRELSTTTEAPLILIPHAFGNESAEVPSDLTEARVLAERLGLSPTVIAEGLDVGQARQVTGTAAMVISSRYHPIVFGLAAGVPCLGIHGDEYCRIKLHGALAHARLEQWMLTYADVGQGALLTKALELWHARDQVRRDIDSCHEAWHKESRERWAVVLRALDPSQTIPAAKPSTMFGRPTQDVAPALAHALDARRLAWEREEGARGTVKRNAPSLRSRLRSIKLWSQ